jgi:hypothetical protein
MKTAYWGECEISGSHGREYEDGFLSDHSATTSETSVEFYQTTRRNDRGESHTEQNIWNNEKKTARGRKNWDKNCFAYLSVHVGIILKLTEYKSVNLIQLPHNRIQWQVSVNTAINPEIAYKVCKTFRWGQLRAAPKRGLNERSYMKYKKKETSLYFEHFILYGRQEDKIFWTQRWESFPEFNLSK